MRRLFLIPALLAVALWCAACRTPTAPEESQHSRRRLPAPPTNAEEKLLAKLKARLAPDPHMAVYDLDAQTKGKKVKLTGEVQSAEAKAETIQAFEQAGYAVDANIEVLPASELGDRTWAISCLSVANGREMPDHKAELGTQILMGHPMRVLKATRHWFYVQSADGYLSWVEQGTVALCTEPELKAWQNSKLAVVTAYEERVLEGPSPDAQEVSDVVMGDQLKVLSRSGYWLQVELPDGRSGFLPAQSTQDFAEWKKARNATAESLERTGRLFLGRPYLWGGNSPKGMDCSGFVKQVFWLNGIQIRRNASEQALQGKLINPDDNLSNLRKGDLMFFGFAGRGGEQPWVTHVAIYLGDRTYIQSSERVRISSLNPAAANYDRFHGRSLLFARRVLGEPDVARVP